MTSENVIPYATREHKPMLPRDVFGIVRTIGLLVAFYGVYCLLNAAVTVTGLVTSAHRAAALVLFSLAYIVCGAVLMRGSWVVRFAYGSE